MGATTQRLGTGCMLLATRFACTTLAFDDVVPDSLSPFARSEKTLSDKVGGRGERARALISADKAHNARARPSHPTAGLLTQGPAQLIVCLFCVNLLRAFADRESRGVPRGPQRLGASCLLTGGAHKASSPLPCFHLLLYVCRGSSFAPIVCASHHPLCRQPTGAHRFAARPGLTLRVLPTLCVEHARRMTFCMVCCPQQPRQLRLTHVCRITHTGRFAAPTIMLTHT